jgi:hypothetical protein
LTTEDTAPPCQTRALISVRLGKVGRLRPPYVTSLHSMRASRCVTFVITYNGVLDQPSNATLAESGSPQTVAQTRRPAWLERAGTKLMPDHDMRDIRADLQERGKILEEQIGAARAQFDTIFARLKQEHDIKVDDLKKELDAVLAVLGFEDQRFGDKASSVQDVGAVVEGRALRRA